MERKYNRVVKKHELLKNWDGLKYLKRFPRTNQKLNDFQAG